MIFNKKKKSFYFDKTKINDRYRGFNANFIIVGRIKGQIIKTNVEDASFGVAWCRASRLHSDFNGTS